MSSYSFYDLLLVDFCIPKNYGELSICYSPEMLDISISALSFLAMGEVFGYFHG
jgi:hypothetical protein